MKILKPIFICFSILCLSFGSAAQDKRTTETKVADLLAQLPANNSEYTDKLMADMFAIGEPGLKMICSQIIPAGAGDDTRSRFAVESLSRFLSRKGNESKKASWEKICIDYAVNQKDNGVKDFFMKQLQLIGSDATVSALKGYLSDKEICGPALAAIQACSGKAAETALAESLKDTSLPCAAAVMNALAGMRSQVAVPEYIAWSSDINANTRASALNALAQSGSPLAYAVLSKAAKAIAYRWEPTGATSALLTYATNAGKSGDLKTMDRICKVVMSKCRDKLTVQNKARALKIYAGFHGRDAAKELLKAAEYPDKTYRDAAFQASLAIPGEEILSDWINYFPGATAEAKPEIIRMLGTSRSKSALQLINSSLSDADSAVRIEAASALVKTDGKNATQALIGYIMKFTGQADQAAAKYALMTIAGNEEVAKVKAILSDGPPEAKKTALELLAWNGDNRYFDLVLPFTSSENEPVRAAAYKALADLADPGDQVKLIDLLYKTTDKGFIQDVQNALASAAATITDTEERSQTILRSVAGRSGNEKVIPVLGRTGGREALAFVLKEFENGSPEMRDVCFKTLTTWRDYTASQALYEICASGNKNFEDRAFEGYVSQVKKSNLTDEQKLLLYRKIMSFALSPARKNTVLKEIGRLKTYQSLFFAANYLDDPSTSAEAANSAMYIALPSANSKAGMYGSIVREILSKAALKVAGPESEYNKEMINKYLAAMPADEGFKPLFNGTDLTGWQGLVENPVKRANMRRVDLERMQAEANVLVPQNWAVKDGCIWFNGKGNNLCTIAEYGDFEMLVDWKISKEGDSGIYLRGTPQVQIWDTSRTEVGAQVGSGGLYNNQTNPSKPLVVADNPVGDWNSFRIVMTGEKVSVWLNGIQVVDNVTLENYWDRKIPIFPKGPVELQAHGTDLGFRDLFIREISDKDYNLTPEEKSEGFISLFNGRNLDGWIGNKESYVAEDGMIVIKPENGSGGNLYTGKEYSDFVYRFEFQLTPAANNGIGIRAPRESDAAYTGMEIQVLDNTAPVYADLQPYQYHGSVYGVIPAKREFLKPLGEWNYEEIIAQGTHIVVTLNGTVIVDGDIAGPRDNGTMDHNDHPGLKNKTGYIGFLGHGSVVKFRNIRVRDLSDKE